MGFRLRTASGVVAALALVLVPFLVLAPPGGAQESDETGVLRRATVLEAGGRHGEARALLEELLERSPTSSAGLFSLERVLRPLGEVRAVLPFVDRYLGREPGASAVRYLKLRVLDEIDSIAGLEAAVRDWITAESLSPEAYREGARVLEERFGAERALEVLRRGRAALGSSSALALETGDVLLRSGDAEAAVEEWALAVGAQGSEVPSLLRRLEGLEGERAAGDVVGGLLDALDREPTTTDRRRAGVRIALATGREDRAVELGESVAARLEGTGRLGFLAEVAREAGERGLPAVSLWAFRAMREDSGAGPERLVLDRRIAVTALAAADTAAALEALVRVARALEPGSAERRRVVADVVRLEADAGHVGAERLLQRLDGFRSEFPGAPELDGLASAVAAGLRARGRVGDASRVLEGVSGPQSALERAYLLFEDGSVQEGTEALLAAVGGLEPDRATQVIQLASVLERASPAAAALLAGAAALAHRGEVDEALAELEGGVDGVSATDRPALLAHGARLAAAGSRPESAALLRERLLRDHPDAPEVAEATLALARWRARDPGGASEAARLLEALILERPNSPVVPAARRELARLRSGSAGAGESRR